MLLLVLLAACQPELRCREPDVEVWTVEGEPAAACDVTFSACDPSIYLTVSCSDDTFEGDYACLWTSLEGLNAGSGSFTSDDFCKVDPDEMAEQVDEAVPYALSVE